MYSHVAAAAESIPAEMRLYFVAPVGSILGRLFPLPSSGWAHPLGSQLRVEGDTLVLLVFVVCNLGMVHVVSLFADSYHNGL